MGDESLSTYEYETLASGLAAVWARENTREGIFNGMQKKETYATTGTRIVVRFFGGWDYASDDLYRPDVVSIGYDKGVPMGGDLASQPAGKKAPTFMVGALRDPSAGNLDRIQIIKGWVDKKGKRHEKIYDVAVSDGRPIDADGRCRTPVGNTVVTDSAIFTNDIGDAELRAIWTDPDFDPRSTGCLLRSGHGNPDTNLASTRYGIFWDQDERRCTVESSGKSLHLAHLVHTLKH